MRTIPLPNANSAAEFGIQSDDAIRVLVSSEGDVSESIRTLPVACCLRKQFPNAFIGWVTESKSDFMLQGHPAIDEVIELPRRWYASMSGLRDTRRTLRTHRFDCFVDCQSDARSALAGYLSGAARRIGFSRTHRAAFAIKPIFSRIRLPRLTTWLHNEKVVPVFHHLIDRSLELLTPMGIHHPQVNWGLSIDPSDQAWAEGYCRNLRGAGLVILGPGGDWPSKLWEPDRFASTSRYLADRYGYHSMVIWGTFEERLIAEEIVSLSEGTATLAPSTSLQTLAALIERADLFIGCDAGPLHLSVAVGTKAVGLYGATHFGDRGPYGHVSLQIEHEEGSSRRRRKAGNRAMRAIGVEHVCAVIDELHSKVTARAA